MSGSSDQYIGFVVPGYAQRCTWLGLFSLPSTNDIPQVAVATAACEEEQTRSDGRNALFDAMMVREKDTHDR